jgi:hypothetical protein
MLDYIRTERGNQGRVPVDGDGNFSQTGTGQAVERKNAFRIWWNLPLFERTDLSVMYGWERIHNLNLVEGENRTNQLVTTALSYRF